MEFECGVLFIAYSKHTRNTNLLLASRVNAMFSLHQNNALGHFFPVFLTSFLMYPFAFCRNAAATTAAAVASK